MHHFLSRGRSAAACAGCITCGTLALAMLSALVPMSGCHAGPGGSTAIAAARDAVAIERPAVDAMPRLQPFDEWWFYVAPAGDTQASQN